MCPLSFVEKAGGGVLSRSFNPSLSQGFPTPPRGQLSPGEKASGPSCSSSPAVVATTHPEGPCPGHLDQAVGGAHGGGGSAPT